MTGPLGQSFAPIGSADEEQKKPNPAQQAIQVLSMRMPRVRGARAISPLVGEPGSAARRQVGGFSPESAILQTLLQTLAGQASVPMGALPGAASPGAMHPLAAAMGALGGGQRPDLPSGPPPAPVIVPGIDPPAPPTIYERPMGVDQPSSQMSVPSQPVPLTPDDLPNLKTGRGLSSPPPPSPAPPPNDGWGPDQAAPSPPSVDPRLLSALMDLLRRGGGGR